MGTAMVLDGPDCVRVSDCSYDRRVVGLVAGAGRYRPGVVLDHRLPGDSRQALAMVGKTFLPGGRHSAPSPWVTC